MRLVEIIERAKDFTVQALQGKVTREQVELNSMNLLFTIRIYNDNIRRLLEHFQISQMRIVEEVRNIDQSLFVENLWELKAKAEHVATAVIGRSIEESNEYHLLIAILNEPGCMVRYALDRLMEKGQLDNLINVLDQFEQLDHDYRERQKKAKAAKDEGKGKGEEKKLPSSADLISRAEHIGEKKDSLRESPPKGPERNDEPQIDLARERRRMQKTGTQTLPQNASPAGFHQRRNNGSGGLNDFCTDLTQLAYDGKLDPVIGRDEDIKRICNILCKKVKNNPVIIGEAGVGKTAIVEGLAIKIVQGEVPDPLKDKHILSLNMGSLVANTQYRGSFEGRLQRLIAELKASPNIILFIDELHQIVGAGTAEHQVMGASDMLKPELARGTLHCIGATTPKEYGLIEKDAALERRFQLVRIEAPSVEETLTILQGLRSRYESHHNVRYNNQVLEAAVVLSNRYIPERNLPDKAIDLIDEAGSQANLSRTDQNPVDVTEDHVVKVLTMLTGQRVLSRPEEQAKLSNLKDELNKHIIGQDEVISLLARAARALHDPNRPLFSALFTGPTGVGKTETAKALAEVLFNNPNALVRIDMSEYKEPQSVARLTGSHPGYVGYEEGGQLTEAVRKKHQAVVLLDEIEKAHKNVWDVLLQLLDEGRLTDGKGRTVNFRNCVIIATSNIDVHIREKQVGFTSTGAGRDVEENRKIVEESLIKAGFRRELINRIDYMFIFNSLEKKDLEQILMRRIADLNKLLSEQGLSLELNPEVKEFLLKEAESDVWGARELNRVVREHLQNPLGAASSVFSRGTALLARLHEGKVDFYEKEETPRS